MRTITKKDGERILEILFLPVPKPFCICALSISISHSLNSVLCSVSTLFCNSVLSVL
jgi:hypothetical protein